MSTNRRSSSVWKILISILLILVLLIIAAEFGLRWLISDQMKKDFAERAGTTNAKPAISFGPTPLLLSQLTGVIPSVKLETPASLSIAENPDGTPRVAGTPESEVSITDLNIKDRNNPTAGEMRIRTLLPETLLLAQSQAGTATPQAGGDPTAQMMANLIKVTNIDTVADQQAIKVELTGGIATLTLKPKVEGGKLSITAENASLLGMNLPAEATKGITKALESGSANMSGDLKVDDIYVHDDGLEIYLSGTNVPFNELQTTPSVEGVSA